MAAREWGLLKIQSQPLAAVRSGGTSAHVRRTRCICPYLAPPADMQLDGIISAASSLLCLHFFLHSLVPSMSLCPQASAIRCCQEHPFLKIVWCGSLGGFADRGHTCIKEACGTHSGKDPRHLSVKDIFQVSSSHPCTYYYVNIHCDLFHEENPNGLAY